MVCVPYLPRPHDLKGQGAVGEANAHATERHKRIPLNLTTFLAVNPQSQASDRHLSGVTRGLAVNRQG